jgi:ABC-type polysaccharide/polyol phosphate export permease
VTALRWAILDGWTITQRDVLHWVNQPFQIAVGLLFPVMIVLMFGYLLGGAMSVPGGGNYREFLMPGMFATTMLFGIESTFQAISTDAARGITDRFRSLPMAASAVVVGRGAADMLQTALGLAVMIVCGLAVGWQWRNGVADALLAVALLLWLRFALIWMGIYLGLVLKNPDTVMAVQILVWPLGFLSNVYAAPETMPGALGALAEWNPLSSTVAAARALFGNPGWGGDSWIAANALGMAILWPLVLTLVFFPLAVRAYSRLDR